MDMPFVQRDGPMRTWFSMAVLGAVAAAVSAQASRAEELVWKPVSNGVLKMDDRPVKRWEIYVTRKKEYLLLLAIGERFLLLDTQARAIYELAPATLKRRQNEVRWNAATLPTQPLPSTDWTIRDVGPARRIRLRLTGEGRVLEVQVPIHPDLRWAY